MKSFKLLFFHLLSVKYRDFAVRFDGKVFATLFNLRALVRKKPIRLNYEKKHGWYRALTPIGSIVFYEKRQNWNTLQEGLTYRGDCLAKDYFLDYVNFTEGDIVVDVGANIGDFKISLKLRSIPATYIAIEPSPSTYTCLRENVAPSIAYNVALSDSSGFSKLFISESNADTSLIEPRCFESEVQTRTLRLDDLIPDRPIRFLKVEAEGAEPEVLTGAERCLHKIDFIAVDVGPERGIREEFTVESVTNYLIGKNFKMIKFGYPRVVLLFQNNSISG